MRSLTLQGRFEASPRSAGHVGLAILVPTGAGGTRAGKIGAGPARRDLSVPEAPPQRGDVFQAHSFICWIQGGPGSPRRGPDLGGKEAIELFRP